MENVTLEYLFTNKFEKTGLEVEAKKNTSGMFTKAELGMLPRSDSEKLCDLKIMMGDYIYEKGGYKNVYVMKGEGDMYDVTFTNKELNLITDIMKEDPKAIGTVLR